MSQEPEIYDLEQFKAKYVKPYDALEYVFWPEKGYVVWRPGSGNNTELLHIRTFVNGKGYSKELIREMLSQLKANPPFFSVFGFALSNRSELKAIYQALGFNISPDIEGMYKGGPMFMFSQSYQQLCRKYEVQLS